MQIEHNSAYSRHASLTDTKNNTDACPAALFCFPVSFLFVLLKYVMET